MKKATSLLQLMVIATLGLAGCGPSHPGKTRVRLNLGGVGGERTAPGRYLAPGLFGAAAPSTTCDVALPDLWALVTAADLESPEVTLLTQADAEPVSASIGNVSSTLNLFTLAPSSAPLELEVTSGVGRTVEVFGSVRGDCNLAQTYDWLISGTSAPTDLTKDNESLTISAGLHQAAFEFRSATLGLLNTSKPFGEAVINWTPNAASQCAQGGSIQSIWFDEYDTGLAIDREQSMSLSPIFLSPLVLGPRTYEIGLGCENSEEWHGFSIDPGTYSTPSKSFTCVEGPPPQDFKSRWYWIYDYYYRCEATN
jgi:hypothetical protein